MSERLQFCTFRLDGLLFGINVCDVQEVLRPQQIRRVPLAADSIRGLINLRGQVVTTIDPRVCLNLPLRTGDRQPASIIVRAGTEPVSLLVDEIGDIQEVDASAFELPPETLRGISVDLLAGMYKLENCLLLALNAASVVNRALSTPGRNEEQNEQDPSARRR